MIYILEDDDTIRKLVIYALKSQAYEAQGFSCPSAFWPAVEASLPSLILLDLMLPEEDGISILNRLRSHQLTRHIPVIILTAKSSELDRVEGLDAGADDYVIKPFSILELLARVRAVLRRSEQGSQEEKDLRIGDMIISVQKHEVSVNGRLVALTQKEFSLLYLLASHEGRAHGVSDHGGPHAEGKYSNIRQQYRTYHYRAPGHECIYFFMGYQLLFFIKRKPVAFSSGHAGILSYMTLLNQKNEPCSAWLIHDTLSILCCAAGASPVYSAALTFALLPVSFLK